MSRKTKIVSGVAGALTMFGVGVAVAAILLSTSITGQASVIPGAPGSGTSNEVKVAVTTDATNGANLNCDDIGVSDNFTTLTFNPKLTVPANGGNASNVPVAGGSCTVKVTVKNTGSKTIRISPDSSLSLPNGWVPTDFQVSTAPLAPGSSQVIQAKISANQNAQTGQISGKLVYTDAS